MRMMLSSLTPRASMHALDAAAAPVDNLDSTRIWADCRQGQGRATVYAGSSLLRVREDDNDRGLVSGPLPRSPHSVGFDDILCQSVSRRVPRLCLGSRSPRTPQFCDFKILEKLTRFPFTQSLGVAHG